MNSKNVYLLTIILLTMAAIGPLSGATPSKSLLNSVTSSLEKLETAVKTNLEKYNRYKEAGKLYESTTENPKACELLRAIEDAVDDPAYAYKNALKGGWTVDNPEMKKLHDKVYEYYTGKISIPDSHFIVYMDEPELPEDSNLRTMCDIMRQGYLLAREKGVAAADAISSRIREKNTRYDRMMKKVKAAALEGSTRYVTADIESKPVYKRAMATMKKYEDFCNTVLAKVKVERDKVRAEIKKLHEAYTAMYEPLFKNIYNKDYTSDEQKFADALNTFDKETWPKYGSFIEGLAAKWAPKNKSNLDNSLDINNEVNESVRGLLGSEYSDAVSGMSDPGNMISTILIKKSYIPGIRKACSNFLLESIKRDIDTTKHIAEVKRAEAFQNAVKPLPRVFEFDPNNEEAKKLKDSLKADLAKMEAEINKKIDAREWPFAHSESAPANAVELAEEVWKVLSKDKTWTEGKRHLIAMKIVGDWSIIEYNILKQPVRHGLPVSIIAQFDDQKGKDLCWEYQVMYFTKMGVGVKPEPPFTHHGGADRNLMRLSRIHPGIPGTSIADDYVHKQISAIGAVTATSAGGSSTGPIGWAVRLTLSLALIAAGLLAASTVIVPKVSALAAPLESLKPHSATIGVVTLGTGLVSFVLSVLSFSPLAHILPQVSAVAVGLLLGKSILLKKPEGKPAEPVNEPSAVSEDQEKNEEHKDEALADKAAEAATKAAEATEEAAKAAQELLIKNKELFDKLEKIQVPMGFSSVALGILHLLGGCFWLF